MDSIKRVEKISKKSIYFYKVDINNKNELNNIFKKHTIDAVIHFAGLKILSKSIQNPIDYYKANVAGSIILAEVMNKFNCKKLVFSSSASVYGDSLKVPICEDFPLKPQNPYARSKLVSENFFQDVFNSDPSWSIALLRYFNPVGAHKSGLIGEDSVGIPTNLMPYISQVAFGLRQNLSIFGNDYDTHDGTGVRDYIHVEDIARAHVNSLRVLETTSQLLKINLGTGKGYSVLDVVKAFEKASGRQIPYKFLKRRYGDVDKCFTNPELASQKIKWEAKYGIDEMCEDAWRWQLMNPSGYN